MAVEEKQKLQVFVQVLQLCYQEVEVFDLVFLIFYQLVLAYLKVSFKLHFCLLDCHRL